MKKRNVSILLLCVVGFAVAIHRFSPVQATQLTYAPGLGPCSNILNYHGNLDPAGNSFDHLSRAVGNLNPEFVENGNCYVLTDFVFSIRGADACSPCDFVEVFLFRNFVSQPLLSATLTQENPTVSINLTTGIVFSEENSFTILISGTSGIPVTYSVEGFQTTP